MSAAPSLLLSALRTPSRLAELTPPQWDRLLREARDHRLLGRLAIEVAGAQRQRLHPVVRDILLAAERRAAAYQVRMRFEIDRLARGLGDMPGPRLLLKGGAYLMAGLPPARGRISSDVDILVPTARLGEAERRLTEAGWEPMLVDEYDQRYYRQWMHELPPLQHRRRESVVDLHHTILPLTHRFRPDPPALIAEAVTLTSDPRWQVLSPPDMVLHCVVHLFADGDFTNALREVVDLHDLLGHYSQEPGFWNRLAERAALHKVERPMHYALTVAEALLGTASPPALKAKGRPPPLVGRAVRGLMLAALRPEALAAPSRRRALIGGLLYLRSHWLRMPPLLLARHLLTKAWIGITARWSREAVDPSRASV